MSFASLLMRVMNSTEHSIRRSRASRAKVGFWCEDDDGAVGEVGFVVVDDAAPAAAAVDDEGAWCGVERISEMIFWTVASIEISIGFVGVREEGGFQFIDLGEGYSMRKYL